MFFRRLDK